MAPTAQDVASWLGTDSPEVLSQAATVLPSITAMVNNYTRGRGFTRPMFQPAQRARLGHVGDSLTEQGMEVPSTLPGLYKTVTGFADIGIYSKYGQFIIQPAYGTVTTLDAIDAIRASGPEPDVWVVALGTNITASSEQQAAGDTSADAAEVDKLLAHLGAEARVVWVNIGTGYSYPPGYQFHEKLNEMFAAKMAERGELGHVADWWSYCKAECIDKGLEAEWFQIVPNNDKTHMTPAGYLAKYTWLAHVVDEYLDALAAPASQPSAEPLSDVAAVIISVTASVLANPEQLQQSETTGPFTRSVAGWQGFTLLERLVLDRYRPKAM